METSALTNFVEVAKAIGAVGTPVVVVIVAYIFQRKQKVAECAMSERVKRIGLISPVLNKIYSYRQRVGSFLELSPEEILKSKREADKEFWTFEYLWSREFKSAYHDFMGECFVMNRGEGNKAGIRAESRYYPIKAVTPGWDAFTEESVNLKQNERIYNHLQSITARDLGFRV